MKKPGVCAKCKKGYDCKEGICVNGCCGVKGDAGGVKGEGGGANPLWVTSTNATHHVHVTRAPSGPLPGYCYHLLSFASKRDASRAVNVLNNHQCHGERYGCDGSLMVRFSDPDLPMEKIGTSAKDGGETSVADNEPEMSGSGGGGGSGPNGTGAIVASPVKLCDLIKVGGETFRVIAIHENGTTQLDRPYVAKPKHPIPAGGRLPVFKVTVKQRKETLKSLLAEKMRCESMRCIAAVEVRERAIAFTGTSRSLNIRDPDAPSNATDAPSEQTLETALEKCQRMEMAKANGDDDDDDDANARELGDVPKEAKATHQPNDKPEAEVVVYEIVNGKKVKKKKSEEDEEKIKDYDNTPPAGCRPNLATSKKDMEEMEEKAKEEFEKEGANGGKRFRGTKAKLKSLECGPTLEAYEEVPVSNARPGPEAVSEAGSEAGLEAGSKAGSVQPGGNTGDPTAVGGVGYEEESSSGGLRVAEASARGANGEVVQSSKTKKVPVAVGECGAAFDTPPTGFTVLFVSTKNVTCCALDASVTLQMGATKAPFLIRGGAVDLASAGNSTVLKDLPVSQFMSKLGPTDAVMMAMQIPFGLGGILLPADIAIPSEVMVLSDDDDEAAKLQLGRMFGKIAQAIIGKRTSPEVEYVPGEGVVVVTQDSGAA